MSYKKFVSLFAVSTLALAACGTTEDTEEPATDETEQTEEADQTEETTDTEETSDSSSLINDAIDQSGDATPEYGLEVTGAGWTTDGIIIEHLPGEAATIPVTIISEEEAYNTYLLEDGAIVDVVSDEPEPEFTVESPSDEVEYVVGVSPDDLGEVGDEVAVDDFYRSETLLFEEADPAEAEEE